MKEDYDTSIWDSILVRIHAHICAFISNWFYLIYSRFCDDSHRSYYSICLL